MADIINLNRARKDRAAAEKKAQAAENRAKHGRAKAETSKLKAEREIAARKLDGHRRNEETPED